MTNGSEFATEEQVEKARREIEAADDSEISQWAEWAAEGEWSWADDCAGALMEILRLRDALRAAEKRIT